MFYLLFSIICSSLIFIIFKWFERLGVNILEGIVINYWVAAIFGFSINYINGRNPFTAETDWLWVAAIEGLLFISVFFIMATTAQKISVAASSVAAKMSMVIPIVIFMIINTDEVTSVIKVLGIILAILAIYLTTKKKEKTEWNSHLVYLPVLLFLGSGIIDFLIGYAEQTYLGTELEQELFIPTIFMITGLIGIVLLGSKYISGKLKFNPRSIWIGGLLGIVNYGSLFFLIKTFESEWTVKSSIYAINNIGIISTSTMLALFLFGEKQRLINIIGLVLGVIAILIFLFGS